jgi:hypothetical protein
VRDGRKPAVPTPQSPQDERDLGAIDKIFDVPHARRASTPKLGWQHLNASGVPRSLRDLYEVFNLDLRAV